MGRRLIDDDEIDEFIKKLQSGNELSIQYVIGQLENIRDYNIPCSECAKKHKQIVDLTMQIFALRNMLIGEGKL